MDKTDPQPVKVIDDTFIQFYSKRNSRMTLRISSISGLVERWDGAYLIEYPGEYSVTVTEETFYKIMEVL